MGRPLILIKALALVSALPLATNASANERAATAADEQSLNLARELALMEIKDGSASNFEPLERAISLSISTTLASGNPRLQADLTAKVGKQLTPLAAEFTYSLVEAYSKNLTANELRGILAFMRGPGAQAEAANLPILKSKLAAGQAMEPDAVAKMEAASDVAYQQAPQARRDLIERIFKAQNLEEHTRQGLKKLYSKLDTVAAVAMNAESDPKVNGSRTMTLSDDVELDKKVEADVRRTMAIERSFYLTHFADDELHIVATYLESDAGQGMITQLPEIQKTVGVKILVRLENLLPDIMATACATAKCSSDQQDKLTQRLSVMERVLNSTLQ